jgi:Lar family restriction alleviation protein
MDSDITHEVALKPCPFCGSNNVKKDNFSFGYCVMCTDCGCRTDNENTEAKAIARWNRRTTAWAREAGQ